MAAEIVGSDDWSVAFLDHRPVFKGHTLVVPRRHVETFPDLSESEIVPYFGLVQRLCTALVEGLGADGSWVSINNVISQSVPHLHCHVIPRRRKDGLRGFYWPRQKYAGDDEMADYSALIRSALGGS